MQESTTRITRPLDMQSLKLVFGRCVVEALGIEEEVAANVEIEMTGGHGKRSGVDGVSSSVDVDSQRVKATRPAVESQYYARQNDLSVSPEPPTKAPEAFYRVVKPSRRRVRFTIEPRGIRH